MKNILLITKTLGLIIDKHSEDITVFHLPYNYKESVCETKVGTVYLKFKNINKLSKYPNLNRNFECSKILLKENQI